MELLITLVVLAVLAGLVFPVITRNIDHVKAQEAYTALGAVRQAMATYYSANSTYVGASIIPGDPGYIGVDPTAAGTGQSKNFRYDWVNQGANVYTITATCTTCSSPGSVTASNGTVIASGSMS